MNYEFIIEELILSKLNIKNNSIFKYAIRRNENNIHGEFTFKCFLVSDYLGENAKDIAKKLSNSIKSKYFYKIESVDVYLNFYIDKKEFYNSKYKYILDYKEKKNSDNKSKYVILYKDEYEKIYGNILRNIYIKGGNVCELYNEDTCFDYDLNLIYKNIKVNEYQKIKFIDLKKYNLPPFILSYQNGKLSYEAKMLIAYIKFIKNNKVILLFNENEKTNKEKILVIIEEFLNLEVNYKVIKDKKLLLKLKREHLFLEKNKKEIIESEENTVDIIYDYYKILDYCIFNLDCEKFIDFVIYFENYIYIGDNREVIVFMKNMINSIFSIII